MGFWGSSAEDNVLRPVVPLPGVGRLVLLDFVPFIVAPRVVGWRPVPAVDDVTVQQAVGAVVVDAGAEDAKVGLERLQQFVHHVAAGHGVVAKGVVGPLRGLGPGGGGPGDGQPVLVLPRQLLVVVVQGHGLQVLAVRAVGGIHQQQRRT